MTSDNRRLQELKAEVFQAIGHPVRVAIIELLGSGELCVCEIAERVGTERSNCSRHLAVMLRAGVLEVRKDGLRMFYSLKTPCVKNFMTCVSNVLRSRFSESLELMEHMR
jgi:ArsR family transcriptional regulator